MFLWRYNRVTGYWVKEREVLPDDAEQWLKIFQADKPGETFKLSKKRPAYPASPLDRKPIKNPRGKVVRFQDVKKAVAIGKIVAIEYESVRDGKTYRHAFRKTRPQLAVSTDGKQLLILGGGYRVTERGIEDL